ncbi:uncharacterized protein At5g49945-like [Macadamia integrifolia]|uniref:uncharacterized protein At5g49945-like n=1 Tax=Macadamia integrifolia TaxID=60698 RepID=UPI001C4FD4BA|nr:uncharacterized protein At5g49945-like [Macadamia integrifolia]
MPMLMSTPSGTSSPSSPSSLSSTKSSLAAPSSPLQLTSKASATKANQSPSSPPSVPSPKASAFDYWDEDEFEGIPITEPTLVTTETANKSSPAEDTKPSKPPAKPRSFIIEVACISFLICFVINYFTGKRENEKIALAWAAKFATKDSIFDENFSLMGTGDGKPPLLLKEGQSVFKFYVSGRRFCRGWWLPWSSRFGLKGETMSALTFNAKPTATDDRAAFTVWETQGLEDVG